MLIAGGWFKDWASQNQKGALLTGLRTVWIDELALYRRLSALGELPTALDQTAYQADDAEHPALRRAARSARASAPRSSRPRNRSRRCRGRHPQSRAEPARRAEAARAAS